MSKYMYNFHIIEWLCYIMRHSKYRNEINNNYILRKIKIVIFISDSVAKFSEVTGMLRRLIEKVQSVHVFKTEENFPMHT